MASIKKSSRQRKDPRAFAGNYRDPALTKEKANIALRKTVKYPAIELARDLGFSLSEFTERLMEAQLIAHGRIKAPVIKLPALKSQKA